MRHKVKYLLIGAGPTGLGAGLRLTEHGESDFLVVEADGQVGGLAKSFRDEAGFTWDVGGHVQFSHYTYFDELMDRAHPPGGWYDHERESWVWLSDRFVPYPFQNNLRYLPKEDVWKCLQPLLQLHRAPVRGAPANFREWILATFGEGVAELFMLPYNFKVWATPPELMSYGWIGERVSVPDVPRLVSNIVLGKDDLSWGPNNTFRFPRHGGTGGIWEKVADFVGRDRIRLRTRVASIQVRDRLALLDNGDSIQFDLCLNSMPLDRFAAMLDGFPGDLKDAAAGLVHSSTNVVGIGMDGRIPEHLAGKCWMYFPGAESPFYRATVFSHYSPNNVPRPDSQWSLMLEVSESAYKPVDRRTLVDDVIRGLHATKLIRPDEKIVSRTSLHVPYGYPVPSVRRDEILRRLHPALEAYHLYSRGRFGGWKYEVSNQDHSLMQGVEWVDRILAGTTEDTYQCRKGLGAKEKPLFRPKAA